MSPEEVYGPIWQLLIDQAKKKLPPTTYPADPLGGLDNPRKLETPQAPVVPWALKLNGGEATINLPANKGATFQGYLDYHFNPFSPQDFRVNGGGIRYRYNF